MKLQSNRTGKIKDWSFSEWLHYIIHSEGIAGEACDVKEFIERVEKFRDEWEENPKEAWLITPKGKVENWPDTEWADDWDDEKEIGNYFETKEEAEKAVEKLKALTKLCKKGFEFNSVEMFGSGFIRIEASIPINEKTTLQERSDITDSLCLLFGGEK